MNFSLNSHQEAHPGTMGHLDCRSPQPQGHPNTAVISPCTPLAPRLALLGHPSVVWREPRGWLWAGLRESAQSESLFLFHK